MSLRSTLGRARRQLLCSLHRRSAALGNRGPILSFCFDDFPRTAYTVGGSILRGFGARGTYYASLGLMQGAGGGPEGFRADDLRSLVEDGHELATHTFSHVSSRSIPFEKFRQDVRRGQEAIREIGLAPTANFAYPYGEVTLAAKRSLGPEMASCRGIYGGVNGAFLDLNLLRANSLYGDRDQLAEVERLVSENQDQKGWLIFYTHDVAENPTRFGCTPRLLESAISASIRLGARIRTVDQVLNELGLQNE